MGIPEKIDGASEVYLSIGRGIDRTIADPHDGGNVELACELMGEMLNGSSILFNPTTIGMAAGIFRNSSEGVYVVQRDEPAAQRLSRIVELDGFMNSLTPEMRGGIGSIDLRPMLSVQGFAGIGYIRFGDDKSGVTPYHEAAHLLTMKLNLDGSLKNEWNEAAGDVYEKSDFKNWQEMTSRGLISPYSATSWKEDVSELTGYIYAKPELVKRAASESTIFAKKIEILHRRHYITDEHYSYLLHDGPHPVAAVAASANELSIFNYFWNDTEDELGEPTNGKGQAQTQG